MVAAGGTPGQQQFGHGRLGAGIDHVGLQARPDGIQASEPAKKFGVLNPWNGARQTLRHVVVGVDHARNDHVVLSVDDAVGCAWQSMRWANGFNAVVANKNGGIFELITRNIQCGNGVSVLNQEGSHGYDFA